MGTRIVAARDKGTLRFGNLGEGRCRISHAANAGRVRRRPHDDEIIEHDIFAAYAVSVRHKGIFPRAGVHQ